MSPSSNTNNNISLSPPPPPNRHRASSIRSAITLPTLGRRRSASNLQLDPPQEVPKAQQRPQPDQPDAVQPSNQSSMLVIIVSRFLEWLHVHPNHSSGWSTPSSPRSSTDDLVLPLSASAQKISFPENIQQVPPEYQRKKLWRIDTLSSHAPIIIVILLLPISTAFVLWSLSTLPISLTWPRTLSDVAQLGRELHGYAQSGRGPVAHVVGVMAITAIWKHAWSIPGSVIWNVIAGALFSPLYATILLSTLTTIGSLCATLLAMPLAPFLTHFFPRALDMTRNALGGDSDLNLTQNGNSAAHRSAPWVRLSVLRLIGVVPWSGINIACGVCGVSIYDCTLGAFIGCLPWTAVTCQIGDILQTVASTPSPTPRTIQSLLTSPEIILKLIFLTFLSLAPILGRKQLHQWISSSKSMKDGPQITVSDADASKRNWIEEWRMRLRLQSRSKQLDRQQSLKQLAILVDEKRALDALPS